MQATQHRGWTWGVEGQTPVAAINTLGNMQISGNFVASGNVGIGTSSSGGKLDINHAGGQLRLSGGTVAGGVWTNATDVIYLADWNTATRGLNINMTTGNVAIGTLNQVNYKLEVRSNTPQNLRLVTSGSTPGAPAIDIYDQIHGTEFVISPSSNKIDLFTYSGHPLALGTSNTDRMRIAPNGNVGIGTTNPNQKLTVNGTIYGKEVKVDLNVLGPDYVFSNNYQLQPLTELKTYIDQNKHLPEVPSAREMEANGINLGDMNMLLLKKIEELTLYVIEQQSKMEKMQNEIKNIVNK